MPASYYAEKLKQITPPRTRTYRVVPAQKANTIGNDSAAFLREQIMDVVQFNGDEEYKYDDGDELVLVPSTNEDSLRISHY